MNCVSQKKSVIFIFIIIMVALWACDECSLNDGLSEAQNTFTNLSCVVSLQLEHSRAR